MTHKKTKELYPAIQKMVDEGKVEEVIENLTEKQKKFVQEYLIDFNAAASVLRAGYETKYANRIGVQLLDHPGIKAALAKERVERVKKNVIHPEYVIRKVMRTLEQAELAGQHAVVLKGCELLARHLGMFIERKEISGPNGDAIKYEQVQQAADAFTSAISSLIERERADESPIVFELRDPS